MVIISTHAEHHPGERALSLLEKMRAHKADEHRTAELRASSHILMTQLAHKGPNQMQESFSRPSHGLGTGSQFMDEGLRESLSNTPNNMLLGSGGFQFQCMFDEGN